MKRILLILFLLVIIPGCDKNEVDPDNVPDLRPLSPSEEAMVNSTNEFAFNLWHNLDPESKNENTILSPASVSYALSMTYNGAAGNTRTAISDVLNINAMQPEAVNTANKSLTSFLLSLDKLVTLNIANSVWYMNGLTVSNSFEKIIADDYNGKVSGLDFSDQNSSTTINDWIDQATKGMIRKMIDKTSALDIIYLVNAIYFKASWAEKFDKDKTQIKNFYLENGLTVPADMMNCSKAKILLYYNDNLIMADIPYGNGQYAMSVILPDDRTGLDEISSTISESQYEEWLTEADSVERMILMPKFTIESKFELSQSLSDLGMGIAFSDSADFSNLFEDNAFFAITGVLQKAKIIVDEEGTEAAAVTVVHGTGAPGPPDIIEINRPFMFIIHERYTHTILFMGKVMDPTL